MNSDLDIELLQRYMDGTASAEDLKQLNSQLRHDPKTRKEFMVLLNLDSALATVCEPVDVNDSAPTVPDATLPGTHQTTRRSRSLTSSDGSVNRPLFRLVSGVICATLLCAVAWWWQNSSRAWATVQSRVGAGELTEGASLRDEAYEIDAGVVQLVTVLGAQIVIEAPAEFQFESVGRLKLTRGRLSADVPDSAKNFTVVTPSGEAIDLGTRFGVDVPSFGPAEIHVFEGEVIARATGAVVSESLHEGEAVTMEQGVSAARDLRSSAFIQPAEISELNAGLTSGQRKRSEALVAKLKNDPALIAMLDFESDETPPGVFRMAQGRWPGSRAPEFVSVGDHMKLEVGGNREWPQLTLAAWVRLDHLGAPYQSLLHTDGWENSPGQVHWMVTRHSTMRLALFGNTLAPGSDEQEHYPDSQTSVLSERGRWVHLATVYDATTRTVRFYLNGKFDKTTRQAIAHPAKIGPAQIGNWNQQDRKLSGRIDEFVLLGRIMNDQEILALFNAGNPYR